MVAETRLFNLNDYTYDRHTYKLRHVQHFAYDPLTLSARIDTSFSLILEGVLSIILSFFYLHHVWN